MFANLESIKRFRYRILTVAIMLGGTGYLAVHLAIGPGVEVAQVTRKDVGQSVVASGRVANPYRVDVGSEIVGSVVQVPVQEGQTVKAGETLIALDASEATAGVKQAEVAIAQAEAKLRQLREVQLPVAQQNLRQAEANLLNAQTGLQRNRQLKDSGFIGSSALEESERNFEVMRTQVESARKQVQSAQPEGSDYAVATTALEQARATLEVARAKLAHTAIHAPMDGTLIARDVERGEIVQPGKSLMVLAPTGETQIVVSIDERNIAMLRLGLPALASADAYPNQRFAAVVSYINPGIDATRGTVEVKLTVPQPPDYLRQDMTVSADIEVVRHPQVLAVPADAVRDATSQAPWVMVARSGTAHRQAVRVGLRGEGTVEIVEGLSEGDLVVPVSARVNAGDRLRAVPRA